MFGQRNFGTSLLIAGLFAVLMSFGGGWGEAYGQTAGPTPTPGNAKLAITKEASTDSARPGDTVTFTIRVSNTGSTAAPQVQVVDAMPGSFEITGATASMGSVTTEGQTVTMVIAQLDPGVTAVMTITTRVRAGANGAVRNVVVARSQVVAGASAEMRAEVTVAISDTASAAPGTNPGASSPTNDAGTGGATNATVNGGAAKGAGNAAGVSADEGTANNGGIRSALSNTGADSGILWPLFLLGLLLIGMGSIIFMKARRTS